MTSEFEKALQRCIFKLEPYSIQDEIEYYYTISRDVNKRWEGWKIIDQYKQLQDFPSILKDIRILTNLTNEFYYDNYWEKLDFELYDFNTDHKTKVLNSSIKFGVHAANKLLFESSRLIATLDEKYLNDDYMFFKLYDLLESQLLLKTIKSIPKNNVSILLEKFI